MSINQKNKIHNRFLKAKNQRLKTELFEKFKQYRNSISNLLKASKKSYYTNFFNKNLDDLKTAWKGIKEIIKIKSNTQSSLNSIDIVGKIETDSKAMADHFNDFFSKRLQL